MLLRRVTTVVITPQSNQQLNQKRLAGTPVSRFSFDRTIELKVSSCDCKVPRCVKEPR
jgi:hypothetical protein